jgi:hypothetical protein
MRRIVAVSSRPRGRFSLVVADIFVGCWDFGSELLQLPTVRRTKSLVDFDSVVMDSATIAGR